MIHYSRGLPGNSPGYMGIRCCQNSLDPSENNTTIWPGLGLIRILLASHQPRGTQSLGSSNLNVPSPWSTPVSQELSASFSSQVKASGLISGRPESQGKSFRNRSRFMPGILSPGYQDATWNRTPRSSV